MPALQIWPCHVTQEANFEKKKYFLLILHLTLGKAAKFLVGKLSTSEVISQKLMGERKTPPPPPSAIRVKKVKGLQPRSIRSVCLLLHSPLKKFSFHLSMYSDPKGGGTLIKIWKGVLLSFLGFAI